MDQGRVLSILAAGQLGAFRSEKGRWPASKSELIAQDCPALDQYADVIVDEPPSDVDGCQFFSKLPYPFELRARGDAMQIETRDTRGQLVCRLRVVVPSDSAHAWLPRIKLTTTLFTCAGEGKPW